jgi:hypothetical protein
MFDINNYIGEVEALTNKKRHNRRNTFNYFPEKLSIFNSFIHYGLRNHRYYLLGEMDRRRMSCWEQVGHMSWELVRRSLLELVVELGLELRMMDRHCNLH